MTEEDQLDVVSLFAGIGGVDRAFEQAGATVRASVEIDPDCQAVLRRQFPGTVVHGDITEVTGDHLLAAGFVPGRGVLAGGFPCQGLSVAGRRAGLDDPRSRLFWEIMRLAGELRPQWLLLENVPGLLSSVCPCPGDGACAANDRAVQCRGAGQPHNVTGGACPGGCMAAHGGAMGTVLGALGERGYGFAYRVLDAQFLGVPQRRERVLIAGCLGDWAAPAAVLLEPEGGGGDPAAGGEAQAEAPAGAGEGPDGPVEVRVAATLQGGGKRGYRIDAEGAAGGHLVTCRTYPGTGVRRLTPREWERLQGFPDDWTRWRDDGRMAADSVRYRQLGNAVPVPLVRWAAGRIMRERALCQARL